ncbi:MAG: hypothetical protein Terrestrivirus4_152 [Terrestrivirus sp.]|uniref:Uncharacterized protein n=1 Tax=Terrestrivirus sp. TaxID=2487775 RepID=A0A3G4ZNY8_9VIRU|nr:MAG: hypothetical protein Terrestrivirus4_152 [Terrestrivirus sp.]
MTSISIVIFRNQAMTCFVACFSLDGVANYGKGVNILIIGDIYQKIPFIVHDISRGISHSGLYDSLVTEDVTLFYPLRVQAGKGFMYEDQPFSNLGPMQHDPLLDNFSINSRLDLTFMKVPKKPTNEHNSGSSNHDNNHGNNPIGRNDGHIDKEIKPYYNVDITAITKSSDNVVYFYSAIDGGNAVVLRVNFPQSRKQNELMFLNSGDTKFSSTEGNYILPQMFYTKQYHYRNL